MNQHFTIVIVGAIFICFVGVNGSSARADIVYNPTNGHYYERVESDGITWNSSRAIAESMSHLGTSGHLATITSASEQEFVAQNLLPGESTNDIYMLGGIQSPSGPEPDGGWEWITGEEWNYTNWSSNNPNDDGNQDALGIYGNPNNAPAYTFWDDYWLDSGSHSGGFIVEYSIPEPSAILLGSVGLCVGAGANRRKRTARGANS